MLFILMAVALCFAKSKVVEQRTDYLKLELVHNKVFGDFMVEVFIGNPLQKQLLVIDTGSPYLLLKESKCQSCEKSDLPFYNQAESTTFKLTDCATEIVKCFYFCPQYLFKHECAFNITYGITNFIVILEGFVGKDQVRFEDNISANSTPSTLAASYKQSQSENSVQENGIMGLSTYGQIGMMYDWFRLMQLKLSHMKMSLCFQNKRGYMQWGNFSNEINSTINYNYSSGNYKIVAQEINMEGEDLLDISAMELHSGIMIDSGLTACIFPQAQHSKIAEKLSGICTKISTCSQLNLDYHIFNRGAKLKPICFGFTAFNVLNFEEFLNMNYPPIKIKLNGTFFNLPPSNYFRLIYQEYAGYKVVCLHIMPSSENIYILGMPWMMNKKIIFGLDQINPTLTILDGYQCFDTKEQFLLKLSQGWVGYLVVFFLFLFMLYKDRVYSRIRRRQKLRGQWLKLFGSQQANK